MCAVLNLIARKRTHQDSLEEQLVAAIYTINLEKVIAILANGADAGHRIPLERSRMDGAVCFPLRIVVFCLLDYYQDPTAEQQHEYLCAQLVKIANRLLMHGSDAYDAYQFAIEHYSDYRYGDIWTDNVDIIFDRSAWANGSAESGRKKGGRINSAPFLNIKTAFILEDEVAIFSSNILFENNRAHLL
jgi:hypothetical protein